MHVPTIECLHTRRMCFHNTFFCFHWNYFCFVDNGPSVWRRIAKNICPKRFVVPAEQKQRRNGTFLQLLLLLLRWPTRPLKLPCVGFVRSNVATTENVLFNIAVACTSDDAKHTKYPILIRLIEIFILRCEASFMFTFHDSTVRAGAAVCQCVGTSIQWMIHLFVEFNRIGDLFILREKIHRLSVSHDFAKLNNSLRFLHRLN